MGRKVQLRGGSTLEHTSFAGASREITIDTTKNTAVVHDGVTLGGLPLAKESVTDNHEGRLVVIEGGGDVIGSITNKINVAVNALKDGVEIDVDTLKELSDAINSTEADAATSLASAISSLRNEVRNGASVSVDTFKEVEDLLTAVNAELADRYTKAEIDTITDLTTVDGNIVPTGNGTQDIGSDTNRFRAIYVDEAYLSTNTLYIGDTPVLGTDADTVVVKADPDQSILVKTSGTGSTGIQSQHEVQISTSGVNADVKVQATGTNSKVRFAGLGGIELSNDTTIQANLDVTGDVNFTGTVTTSGSAFIVDAETVKTTDNIIVLNDGEVGTGVTAGKAGLQIDRGDAAAFELVFDEASDKFMVGTVGGVYETLGTREYVLSLMGAERTLREAAEDSLESDILTEKVRIDSILAAANADKDSFVEIVSLINSVDTENDTTFGAYVSSNNTRVTAIENSATTEATTRSNAISTLEAQIASEATTRSINDATIAGNLATEKLRIDSILAASSADKDSFTEIVTLINSVDTENDTAFGAYVTSNNARSAAIEASVTAEASTRASAITTVTNAVNSEASTRASAITTVTNAVNSEASTRASAVNAVNSRVDTLLDVIDCGSIV